MSRTGSLAAACAALVAAVTAVQAHEGFVVTEAGEPIAGARVCYLVPGTDADGICTQTDEKGLYDLPGQSALRMRVFADGYLEKVVPASQRKRPVVLERGAVLWVKILDESGEPIPGAWVYVLSSDGRRRGRGGPSNLAGVRIQPLPPGAVIVEAVADGFRNTKSKPGKLVAGEETVIEVRLPRAES